MPNRILRDGILTSEPVASLTWAEEVFYRRLMSVADDHGRFHALPKLIRAACYPLQIDKVADSDIGKWTTACVAAGLVRVYPASDGKSYLQVLKFGQQVRAKSKFPEPVESDEQQEKPPDSNCYQPPANAHLGVVVCEGGDEGGDDKRAGARSLSVADLSADGLDEATAGEFLAHRKRKKAVLTPLAWRGFKSEVAKAGWTLPAAVEKAISRGWVGFEASWVAGEAKPSRLQTPSPSEYEGLSL